MPRSCDFVVIGAGIMGAAAMASLAKLGRVIGLERATPGHRQGSSWGESRMIRLSNFENPNYAPLIRRSVELWEALERDGAPIFLKVGVLEAGPPDGELMTGTRAAAEAGGFEGETLGAEEVRRRFPAVTIPQAWAATVQPGAGLLRADLAIARLLDAAKAAGAELELSGVRAIQETSSGVTVVLDDGEEIHAGAAIVTTGQQIGDLIPSLVETAGLRVRPQLIGWFASGQSDLVGPDKLPAFAFEHDEGFLYGFPDVVGLGVKAAFHRFDDGPIDPAAEAERIRRTLEGIIGPLTTRDVGTCGYTITRDEEFVIDRDPERTHVWFASACSGHGFKFAPAIGEMLAELASGAATTCDAAPFRLERPGLA